MARAVCLHAARNRVTPSDPAVVASIFFVIGGSILIAYQFLGYLGISAAYFFTFAYLGVAIAAPAFVQYSRRYFGPAANVLAAILVGSFLLWWPLQAMQDPGTRLWSQLHDLTDHNAGVALLLAGLAAIAIVLVIGKRPSRSLSVLGVAYLAVLLLVSTGLRADEGWSQMMQGRFDTRRQFALVIDTTDLLVDRYPKGVFGFAYDGSGDGIPGSLASSVNANFLFGYSQVTPSWPNLTCNTAQYFRDYVFAGTSWVNKRSAIQPLLDCGIKAEYVDSAFVERDGYYLFLSFYRKAPTSNVPVAGVDFTPSRALSPAVARDVEGVSFTLSGVNQPDIVEIDVLPGTPAKGAGTVKLRATADGFAGSVRLFDKTGATIASQVLPPANKPRVMEFAVPSLPDLGGLVFSSNSPNARGRLKIESVVTFAADGQ